MNEFIRYIEPNETDIYFKLWSTKLHGYITLPLSISGVIFNLLTIAVFIQKTMRSPTNYILLGISIFDTLLMISYIPYSFYFYILYSPEPIPGQSIFWPYFSMIHTYITLFSHGCSVWLTCFLAFYRFNTVNSCVAKNKSLLKSDKTTHIIIGIIIFVLCLVPFHVLSFSIHTECLPYVINSMDLLESSSIITCVDYNNSLIDNIVYLKVKYADASGLWEDSLSLSTINTWLQACFIRIIPCFLLIILSIMLIYVMHLAKKNHLRLIKCGNRKEYEKAREFNRTTTMLLIVVVSFLIMEFPHGILLIICAIKNDYYEKLYFPLGDLLDVLVLINGSINFFLYCFMSSQFRDKFKQLFKFGKNDNNNKFKFKFNKQEAILNKQDQQNLFVNDNENNVVVVIED